MFESSYAFRHINVTLTPHDYPQISRLTYCFNTRKGRRYIVIADRYQHNVFVIKFHDARFKNSAIRYSMILNDFDFSRILKTVINIAESILRSDNLASFAFYGVHKEVDEKKSTANTQRFRIYRKITEDLFGEKTFLHSFENNVNCYILVNKGNSNPTELLNSIVDMFAREFKELNHLLD